MGAGEGGFAFVLLVKDKHTKKKYALKRVLAQDSEAERVAQEEANALSLLSPHPNIVEMFHAEHHRDEKTGFVEFLLLLEYCPGGSLGDLIKHRNGVPLEEERLWGVFADVCSAVEHMHRQSKAIAHRDIKAGFLEGKWRDVAQVENILLGSDGRLKLCDFGSVCTYQGIPTTKEDVAVQQERIDRFGGHMCFD